MNLLPPFPEVVDSSMRGAFVSCPRNFYYGYLLSLRKGSSNIHLHFGGCIAHAMEVARKSYWQHGLDEIHSVAAACTAFIQQWGDYEPPEEVLRSRAGIKSIDAGLDAILSYFEQYPLGSDQLKPLMINGEPIVEKSFALPIEGTEHPTTGNPIVYAGRFDMLAEFNGAIFVVDEKTTLSLGPNWRSNWLLRGQFTGYVWGARTFGVEASGCIIRGIGILKQSIQHEQVILSRPQWQIEQWLEQLRRDVRRMVEMWKTAASTKGVRGGYDRPAHQAFDQALDSACSSYGGCGYTMLCDSPDPRRWYDEFVQVPWDPLQRAGDAT